MISRIVSVNPDRPGSFEPLLAGMRTASDTGTPLLLGYELSGMAAGILAADCLDHTVTVRWIGVERFCRRHGIAAQLLEKLCELAAGEGADWVDAIVCLPEDNQGPITALMGRYGFDRLEANPSYSFPLEAVLNGSLAKAASRKDPRAVPLGEVAGQQMLREFNRRLETIEGLPYPAVVPNQLLPESRVWIENGKIAGCVLLAPCGEGVELRWLYGKGTMSLLGLLGSAAAAMAAGYPPKTPICMTAMIPSADGLARKLAGDQLTMETPVTRYGRSLPLYL